MAEGRRPIGWYHTGDFSSEVSHSTFLGKLLSSAALVSPSCLHVPF